MFPDTIKVNDEAGSNSKDVMLVIDGIFDILSETQGQMHCWGCDHGYCGKK